MIFVGTSGWTYDWNEGNSLDWYVKNSGLNAVELNMSFYRFPFKNQVKGWSKYNVKWAVKVHRYVTHVKRLSDTQTWDRFFSLMEELKPDFYLFQMPPSFKMTEENVKRVERFASLLGERMAVEFRHESWFRNMPPLDCTVVSIDSPIGTYLFNTTGKVYLRMHGREEWYNYQYSREELVEVAKEVVELKPKDIYVFFNNDHFMLENAREMMEILRNM
ncbi:MAG: DUF72 domain-containing protein [Candidatus Aramenus sulfurataquae]|jgi:uncharacterized protein YecE (DUF72 family)|nr:DUF72 domain-containing protein [Candidatus Aramenus sulfurataquae]